MKKRSASHWWWLCLASLFVVFLVAQAAETVPTDVQIPGTQPFPTDTVPNLTSVGNCGCHDFSGNVVPESVPVFGWQGGMMANAGRDPLFWATVAIAEQDFLPGGGGVGDLCLHCHSVKGWLEGRSTPTNGSGLDPGLDAEGIMCEFCHLLTDPDQPNSIPNPPEGNYVEEQNGDFTAYDATTGDGYYGGAEYVMNSGDTRLGPFSDHGAKHDAIPSTYFRDGRFCGTCHDVSNPAVGDLAPNHGSMLPLPGGFSGVPGSPVADKAAFNNPPASYGIVERTFSEWVASALDTWEVDDFPLLPAELQVAGGALERAYQASLRGTCSSSGDFCNEDANCSGGETCVLTSADYEDGATRFYTCQTCHMAASGGDGAQQGRGDPHKGQIRSDLPRHDQTGFSHWIQDVVQYQDAQGTLVFGGGISAGEHEAMDAAQLRGEAHIQSAASVGATQVGNQLEVTVTNLTGHKLISGYPEGRRMWLNVVFKDAVDAVVGESGAYGPLGKVVNDLDGDPFDVQSILDPANARIFHAEPAMTQDWAALLISLGYPSDMVLEWDRMTDAPGMTLGDLAAQPAGFERKTFHFVLNNAIHLDNRIPPYGLQYDTALERNALPVPDTQFGDPGPGGVFDHFDVSQFSIPAGAVEAEVHLFYQSTSWEYIQFLWLQNDGLDPFLGQEGVHLLDAWLNTAMSPPVEITETTIPVTPVSLNGPGEASGASPLLVTGYDDLTGALQMTYLPACDATGHTLHYGNMADMAVYGWQDADCSFDDSGVLSFLPDPVVGDSLFWVVVGHNPDYEGDYGADSAGTPRPVSASAGACFRPQNLSPVCE